MTGTGNCQSACLRQSREINRLTYGHQFDQLIALQHTDLKVYSGMRKRVKKKYCLNVILMRKIMNFVILDRVSWADHEN